MIEWTAQRSIPEEGSDGWWLNEGDTNIGWINGSSENAHRARLIAAAPELLAMVESLLGHAEDCVRDHYVPTGHDYPDPDIITDARKLLRRIAGKGDAT